MRLIAIPLLAYSLIFQGIAQVKEDLSPIIFICDASGSMWGQMDGKIKMEIASNVLSTAVNNLPGNQKIGLVVYGHRIKGDCKDVEFLVDIANGTKPAVSSALKGIKPLGMTPLAYSATKVIDHLRTSKLKATIILITDGIESCDGNICDVVKAAKKEGIDFRLHIIGFGLKAGETDQLICAANSADGNYYDASDANKLGTVLNEATSQTIDKPKGNVSVYAVKNGIAIDAVVKAYAVVSKRDPIAVRTYGDTAYFYLPPGQYNFEANPLEGSNIKMVTVSGIRSFEDKMVHQDISFDGGKLGITTTNNGTNWDCVVKVLDQTGNVVASVRTYDAQKEVEVNPGIYKITVQALAMEGTSIYKEIENIKINSSEITSIAHDFETGKVSIEVKADGASIDCVVNFQEVDSGKYVSSERTYGRSKEFLLNPGKYKVKITPLGTYKDRQAQTINIEVRKGETVSKSISL